MIIRTRISGAVLVALAACTLAACDKKPEGQVVATVNGEEVTRRDLVSEADATGAGNASEAELKAVQPMLVQGLVDRKLLVQEAKRSNLDKNPQYLALRQRAEETLLAQLLAQSWVGKLQKPSPAAVQSFIAANPHMFGERKALLLDTIVTPSSSISRAQLAPLMNNDAIAALLKARGKPFQRGDRPVDTLTLPKAVVQQLLARVESGEPVALDTGSMMNIVAVRTVRPLPAPANQWNRIAQEALLQQSKAKTTEDELKRLRETADVSYLPEYAPKAKAGGAQKSAP